MNHYLLVLSDQISIRLKGVRSSEEAFGQIVGVSEPVGNGLELFKAKEPEKEGRKFRIVEIEFPETWFRQFPGPSAFLEMRLFVRPSGAPKSKENFTGCQRPKKNRPIKRKKEAD